MFSPGHAGVCVFLHYLFPQVCSSDVYEVCRVSLQMGAAAGGSFSQRLGHEGGGTNDSLRLFLLDMGLTFAVS